MHFFKKSLILFCFFISVATVAQSNNLTELFNQKKYDDVIKILTDKERSISLSVDDIFILSKSYSKVNKQYKSLVLLDKTISELLETNQIKNLSIAYNLKAENLVDLSKTNEGVNFCDSTLLYLEKNNAAFSQELCVKCGVLYNDGGYYKKAYNTYKKITKEKLKQTPIYINTNGVILMNLKKYPKALYYLKKGISISYEANELEYINVGLTNIAKISMAYKNWKKAKKYLDSASFTLKHTKKVIHKKEWLKTYYHFYTLQGKHNEALNIIHQIDDYNNYVYDTKIKEKTQELSAINQRKNVLTKRVTSIDNEIKTTNKTKVTGYLILAYLIIAMTSLALLYMYKNIKLKYQKVLNEQELLTSQMTPHFIFNSLSIVQGMVLNNEHNKASLYLSKFSNILKFIVKDQSQKFIPINEEIIGLKDYVDLQNLSAKKEVCFLVNIDKNIENEFLIPPMIIQPFIENSIIHGFKQEIKNPVIDIHFTMQEKILQCIIRDNGVGFLSDSTKKSKEKSSLAIKIVEDRLAILSKKMKHNFFVTIEDLKMSNEQGTKVILKLPYVLNQQNTLV